jgi:hypothetical protein
MLAISGVVLTADRRLPDESLQDLVRAWAGPAPLSEKEWSRLSSGQPLAMIIDADRSMEMSAVGAIRIGVTPDAFISRLRQIEEIERGSTVLQIGRFSGTPAIADVAGLTLDNKDIERLADCRPGDCGIQLPATAVARAQAAVTSDKDVEAGNAMFRQFLVDLVRGYQSGGDAALEPYVDRESPLSVHAAFTALDSGRRVLAARVPAIARDIAGYPRTRPPGSHEFFYWSKLKFGFKPTVRVNHVLICPVADQQATGLRYVVVSKQLYASHYFDAALEWRMIVADRETGHTVLVYRTDVRSRTLDGFTASLFRGVVKSRARGGLERYLLTVKKSMETSRTAAHR